MYDRGVAACSDEISEDLTPLNHEDTPGGDDREDKYEEENDEEGVELEPVSPRLLSRAYRATARAAPDLVLPPGTRNSGRDIAGGSAKTATQTKYRLLFRGIPANQHINDTPRRVG